MEITSATKINFNKDIFEKQNYSTDYIGHIILHSHTNESSIVFNIGSAEPEKNLDATIVTKVQDRLFTTVKNIVTTLKKDAKKGDFDLQVNGNPLELSSMSFEESPQYLCEEGSVTTDNSCGKIIYMNILCQIYPHNYHMPRVFNT